MPRASSALARDCFLGEFIALKQQEHAYRMFVEGIPDKRPDDPPA
jgi:hypothetical protein